MLSYFSHKFDGKELILIYYRTEPKKFAVTENFYPQKRETNVANFRKKNGFQVKSETPKHGTQIPIYKNGKYIPSLGLLQAE